MLLFSECLITILFSLVQISDQCVEMSYFCSDLKKQAKILTCASSAKCISTRFLCSDTPYPFFILMNFRRNSQPNMVPMYYEIMAKKWVEQVTRYRKQN